MPGNIPLVKAADLLQNHLSERWDIDSLDHRACEIGNSDLRLRNPPAENVTDGLGQRGPVSQTQWIRLGERIAYCRVLSH